MPLSYHTLCWNDPFLCVSTQVHCSQVPWEQKFSFTYWVQRTVRVVADTYYMNNKCHLSLIKLCFNEYFFSVYKTLSRIQSYSSLRKSLENNDYLQPALLTLPSKYILVQTTPHKHRLYPGPCKWSLSCLSAPLFSPVVYSPECLELSF